MNSRSRGDDGPSAALQRMRGRVVARHARHAVARRDHALERIRARLLAEPLSDILAIVPSFFMQSSTSCIWLRSATLSLRNGAAQCARVSLNSRSATNCGFLLAAYTMVVLPPRVAYARPESTAWVASGWVS